MNRSLLLVSTASSWLGTARMPRAFARAGFEVALLTPRDSLAAGSRYVSTLRYLPDQAIPLVFLTALARVVDEVSPRLLVPCDDMVLRLLIALVAKPPRGLEPALHSRLSGLIQESLGDPRSYAPSVDKLLLPPVAADLGIRMPSCAIVSNAAEAEAFAAVHGYPLVLKRRFGFAGEGVAIVNEDGDLVRDMQSLMGPDPLDLGERRVPQLLAQTFVDGPYHSQALVAWQGKSLAGFAWERHVATLPRKGQTSVVRFVRSPQTRAFAETLGRALGINGFFNVQFVIDAGTGEAHLLEINRRIVTHTHLGERVGADLPAALWRQLSGDSVASEAALPDAVGRKITVFPRDWLRDPASPHLRNLPVDVPWDEPEVIEAMLALRHAHWR